MAIIKNPLTIVQTGGGSNRLPEFLSGSLTVLEASDFEGMTSIPNYCFYQKNTLTSVTLPNTIESIGNSAFANCSDLININIPVNVTNIGNFAFNNCDSLESIDLSSYTNLTSIGSNAFSGDYNLKNFVFPPNINSISNDIFYGSGITSIIIPSSATSIGNYSFGYCSSLTSVTFEDNSQLESIGNDTFNNCRKLTSITIPSSITRIMSSTFLNCTTLTAMTILATTPPKLDNINAISTATTKIYIPAGTLSAYQSATNWSNFADLFEELPA